jgi:cell division transport system permease protein
MTLASVTTAAAALTMLGFVVVGAMLLDQMSARVLSKFETAAYTASSITPEQLAQLGRQIAALPNVASVQVITREQAWEQQRRTLGYIPYLDKMKNPLTDEVWVKVRDPKQTAQVAALLRRMPGVESVAQPSETLTRALAAAWVLRAVGVAACVVLLLATALITSNAIRLAVFARRREIRIMQLVGATDSFVRMPFLLEGSAHGLLGAILAYLLLSTSLTHGVAFVQHTVPFLPVSLAGTPLGLVYVGLAGAGGGIGAVASAVSVGRFLRA